MTRHEEILEYANTFKGEGTEREELEEVIRLAIIDGALWADEHPRKGLVDVERACEWMNKHARGFILTFKDIKDFRKAMEE